MAARLALSGQQVSGLARGATLAAVRAHGLRLHTGAKRESCALTVSDDAAALGPQDLVVLALKGPALVQSAAALRPLLGPGTLVLPAMNGVPWWFLQTGAADPRLGDRRLLSVDPHRQIEAALPLAQVLGCVVHLTCSSPEPGLIQHGFGKRLIVGEPAGGTSARVAAVCAALAQADIQAEPSADIRQDIWYKLWGNMTMNPVSALTGATSDRILDDPLVFGFILRTMAEAAEIGAQIGCPITQSGEERMGLARQLGAFRTSMLQDTLAARPLELDALVTAVQEIGARLKQSTPCIDALLGLTRLMARQRGLYPA